MKYFYLKQFLLENEFFDQNCNDNNMDHILECYLRFEYQEQLLFHRPNIEIRFRLYIHHHPSLLLEVHILA